MLDHPSLPESDAFAKQVQCLWGNHLHVFGHHVGFGRICGTKREEAAKKLNTFQRRVVLHAGTEPAFTGKTINGYS